MGSTEKWNSVIRNIERMNDELSQKANTLIRMKDIDSETHILLDEVYAIFNQINELIKSGVCEKLNIKQYDSLLDIISSWHRYFITLGIVLDLPNMPNLTSTKPAAVAKKINRDVLVGKVVKVSGNKTVKVETFRTYKHDVYGKIIKKRKYYATHDENNETRIGDEVLIASCRPLSKTKHYRLLRIIRSAR